MDKLQTIVDCSFLVIVSLGIIGTVYAQNEIIPLSKAPIELIQVSSSVAEEVLFSDANSDTVLTENGTLRTTIYPYDRILDNGEWVDYILRQNATSIEFISSGIYFDFDLTDCSYLLRTPDLPNVKNRISHALKVADAQLPKFCSLDSLVIENNGVVLTTDEQFYQTIYHLSAPNLVEITWDSQINRGISRIYEFVEICNKCEILDTFEDHYDLGFYKYHPKNGTHGAFKSADRINSDVEFRYKKTLQPDEKLFIDPTYSSDVPNDKFVRDDGNNDLCDGNAVDLFDNNFLNILTIASGDANDCYRSGLEWDISSIPDTAVITDVDFSGNVNDFGGTKLNIDFMSAESQPSTLGAGDFFTDAGDGTTFVDATPCDATGAYSIDLGTDADTDLKSQLSSDWFGLYIKFDDETIDGDTHECQFNAVNVGVDPPVLTVEYISQVSVIPRAMDEDLATINTDANIILLNSTGSLSIAVNNTAQSKFTGLTPLTNQNFSLHDTGTDYIINKTINKSFSSYSTFDMQGQNYMTSCASNGSGDDIAVYVNETDYSVIDEWVITPTCDSNDDVSWSIIVDGYGSLFFGTNKTSTMKAEILSTSDFGANSDSFTVNGTTVTTSYMSSWLNSSTFDFTDGKKQNVRLDFVLSLQEPADSGGGEGGGGSGGSGGSGSLPIPTSANIINLNLVERTHTAFLGQLITSSIPLTWGTSDDIKVTKVLVGETQIMVGFQEFPITYLGDISGQSSGDLIYQIQIPETECNDEITTNCIDRIVHQVPLTVEVEVGTKTIVGTTFINIDLTSGVNFALVFVGIAVILAIIGMIGALSRKKNSPRKNNVTRKSLK